MYSRRGLVSNYSQKRRRERLKLRLIIFTILFFVILCGLIIVARLPYVRISDIEISGTKLLSSSEIENQAWKTLSGNYFLVFPKNNVFLYPESAIVKAVAENQAIDGVAVSIQNFHTIKITVAEREAVALWCGDAGNCYLVSTKGLIFEPASSTVPTIFIRFSGGINREPIGTAILSAGDMQKTLSFAHTLETDVNFKIENILLREGGIFEGELTDGTKIIWNNLQDLGAALLNLKLLLASPEFKKDQEKNGIEYIDIQNSNKVFYKPLSM